jgi:steroid delta-isomerase-like uncharacterized protein
MPDQRFDIYELVAEGDAVVATWFWTGTHTGDMAGFPASGRQIKMSGATIYYFDGDRITRTLADDRPARRVSATERTRVRKSAKPALLDDH